MTTKKQLQKLYKEWAEKGVMPDRGLCDSIFFAFTTAKCYRMFAEFLKPENTTKHFWGYDGFNDAHYYEDQISFTPLRQNLMLLLIEIIEE